jgi:hypothetical protein
MRISDESRGEERKCVLYSSKDVNIKGFAHTTEVISVTALN